MKEIDWTKPIGFDNGSTNVVEYVGYDPANGAHVVKWFSKFFNKERVGIFDKYGNGAYAFGVRNIPEPKRRGELFVTVFERPDGTIGCTMPRVDADKEKVFGYKHIATVKIGEWEEGQ